MVAFISVQLIDQNIVQLRFKNIRMQKSFIIWKSSHIYSEAIIIFLWGKLIFSCSISKRKTSCVWLCCMMTKRVAYSLSCDRVCSANEAFEGSLLDSKQQWSFVFALFQSLCWWQWLVPCCFPSSLLLW